MKGIYFTTQYRVGADNNVYNTGIGKKIEKQIEMFEAHGMPMYFFNPEKPVRAVDKVLRATPLRYEQYRIDRKAVAEADFMYIRKPLTIDYRLIDYLKGVKKIHPEMTILMEIPTYPYDNELKGLKKLPRKMKDRAARKKLKDCVDVILTYSKDESIFGIPTINISNGIDCAEINKYHFSEENDGLVHAIACACFNFYHGYDRAIEGLHQYLEEPGARKDIRLEVVGDGGALDGYKELVRKYGLEPYVNFYGKKEGRELSEIYHKCDIGLDSMGRHRSGVYYNSSLKGKEYCACGLVVVSGVGTELDDDPEFPYYLRIPADDTPMDWKSVLAFYDEKTEQGTKRQQVKEAIRTYAEEHFDMKVVFEPVIEYIWKNTVSHS